MAGERQSFDYFAFICCADSDEKDATALRKRLEKFRVPASIREQSALHEQCPTRMTPLFFEYVSPVPLSDEQLAQTLGKSHYLIVICSPEGAKSERVEQIIRTFAASREDAADNIIPYIVSGQPYGIAGKAGCYPPFFLEMEDQLLGVDQTKEKASGAFLSLTARMLGLNKDALKKFEETLAKKAMRRRILIAVAVLLPICAFVFYSLPRTSYYLDYKEVDGVPVGLMELSGNDVMKQQNYYKFVDRRIDPLAFHFDRVLTIMREGEMDVSNASEQHGVVEVRRFAKVLFLGSQPDRIILVGNDSQKKCIIDYPAGNIDAVDYLPGDEHEQALPDKINEIADYCELENVSSSITRHLLSYNENGQLERRSFCKDSSGIQAANDLGVYGLDMSYDEYGRLVRVFYLNEQYAKIRGSSTPGGEVIAYDDAEVFSGGVTRTLVSASGVPLR